MNKVILNGIDVSEAVNKLEQVKKLIEVIRQAEQTHRANGYICFGKGLEREAKYHFGRADGCLATINDLERILGDN